MKDIVFKPFKQQREVLQSPARIKGAFAGKRSGKTEVGAIQGILWQEQKPNAEYFKHDPYVGLIIAPTFDMLRRLSMKKFLGYAKPFIKKYNQSTQEITWHDGSLIYGISADRPERAEGIKAGWAWKDETLQMKLQMFLEVRARISDSRGMMICTGSLGVQFANPKQHWAHSFFKERPDENTKCFEWGTEDNPHYPQDELASLRNSLDPLTFRQMFQIDWDTVPKSAVYAEFDEANVTRCTYREDLPTYVSIDWGFAHPMAAGIFQYDKKTNTVFMIEEIIESRLKIEQLHERLMAKPYKYTDWICDIAGNQEREQTGISNVQWFRKMGIKFKFRQTAIQYGIPIVRSFIKNGKAERKLLIDPSCKKTIDGMKRYAYPEKDGVIQNENPVKKDDDAVDMVRYFFVNVLDPKIGERRGPSMVDRL